MAFGTTPPRNDYIGNNTTPTYSFGFRIFAATDLKVSTQSGSAAPTLLTYPTDFTVPADSINNQNGGTITLTAGNLPSGVALTIRFSEVTNQPTDLRNQGGFFLEVIEDMVDRAVRFVQQVEDIVNRSLHLPETEVGTAANATLPIKAVRSLMYLGFDVNGNPVALAAPAGTTAVSAFMAGILTKADAAAALGGLWVDAISPAQITANQNDYNPGGLASVNALRITTDASRNITGLTTGVDGRLVAIFNVGSFNAVLVSESASSTAANRFKLTGDVTLLPNASILLRYDGTSSRWRPVSVPTVPFPIAAAGGTVDAITATFSPAITLADQMLCAVVCAGANATATPTFAPNGLTAHTITRNGGAALVAGDIGAAGFVALLEYNLANTRWELLNPVRPLSAATTPGTLTAGATLTKNPVAFGSTTTQAHGLGVEPTFVKVILECITGEQGWSTGDRIHIHGSMIGDTNSVTSNGISIDADATNVNLRIGGGAIYILTKATWSLVVITAANWKVIVTPYKLN